MEYDALLLIYPALYKEWMSFNIYSIEMLAGNILVEN